MTKYKLTLGTKIELAALVALIAFSMWLCVRP